ncbi:hypothetical protein ENSA5_61110 [Enhygromyxa salina]|uniref:Uncharacterized protein n=1 Tax=Enhygromyxa salina TaxID=215803 RepID=A0A2S9XDU9_9BACT|nr:hypothetical protein [Enhygromyxa salina]PRP90861.1 hypothetical protein ENSA5_61110 [Enhygromyxa salina]
MSARPPHGSPPCSRHVSPCALVGLALGLTLLAAPLLDNDTPESATARAPAEAPDPLRGLWMRYDSRAEGDPLRFWYFHGDGKGLYRYGKVGLANTHSFDYQLDAEPGQDVGLELRFRKRGDEHSLTAALDQDGQGRTWMTLRGDPYEPGARYRKVESELDFAALARPSELAAAKGIGDRIWIDYRNLATGGSEFHMYQLAATAIDGRGVGWFHRGDFDDWSTESLTYRIDGDRVELFFDIREEPNSTSFRVISGEQGRVLVLDEDPRDFWATHRYRDGGRSFETAAFDLVIGLQRWLTSSGPRPRSAG